MKPATTAAAPLLIGAALIAAAGCRPDFAPYNRLTNPLTGVRVLAIKSDPATPNTGETSTLSALVFTPEVDPTLTYAWSWCPYAGTAGQGYPCLITEDQVRAVAAQIGQVGEIPSFDLGTAPTATLTNGIDRQVLQALCSGIMGAPKIPDCGGGFPIQIRLMVTTAGSATAIADHVETVFTVRWRFDDTTPANTLPVIDDLTATIAGNDVSIPETDPTITLSRVDETPLLAAVTHEQAETYDGFDDDGNPTTLVERLFLTWFVETGGTEKSRSGFIDGSTDFAEFLKNSWLPGPEKEYPNDTARLFVVIHDSRGGVTWRNGIVKLEPSP